MTTRLLAVPPPVGDPPDELRNGDRLTQPEFHELYKQAPAGVRAELIGGIVYTASPLRARHGSNHLWLGTAFVYYQGNTPGTQVCDNATVILDGDSEPQPDLFLGSGPNTAGGARPTPTGIWSARRNSSPRCPIRAGLRTSGQSGVSTRRPASSNTSWSISGTGGFTGSTRPPTGNLPRTRMGCTESGSSPACGSTRQPFLPRTSDGYSPPSTPAWQRPNTPPSWHDTPPPAAVSARLLQPGVH